MRRREFITLLGSGATWPLTARAQQPTMPVVGFVFGGWADTSARYVAAFRKGLNETGYVEGQNVTVEYQRQTWAALSEIFIMSLIDLRLTSRDFRWFVAFERVAKTTRTARPRLILGHYGVLVFLFCSTSRIGKRQQITVEA
jgi:hypothetical protein